MATTKRASSRDAGKRAKKKRSAKTSPARSAIDRLRKVCLALPSTTEVEAWGEPTFRVNGKIFAMHASANTHHGFGRPAVWILSVNWNRIS